MGLPILDILQFVLENQQPPKDENAKEEIDDLKASNYELQSALFGEYKIFVNSSDSNVLNWDQSQFKKVFVPGALNQVFGYNIQDGSNPYVIYSEKKYIQGITDTFLRGDITLKSINNDIIYQYINIPTLSSFNSIRNKLISLFTISVTVNPAVPSEFASGDSRYDGFGISNNYSASFLGQISEEITNFQNLSSYTIENSPGVSVKSPFDEILTYTNNRIENVISLPRSESSSSNGLRQFLWEFLDTISVADVDGLSDKFGLITTQLDNKISDVTANNNTGISVSRSGNAIVITENKPVGYYTKAEVDTLISGFSSSVTYIDNLLSTSTASGLSANQGRIINESLNLVKTDIANIQTLLNSNDLNLDTIQEIVNYIKSNKSLIDSITTDKVSTYDLGTISDYNFSMDAIL